MATEPIKRPRSIDPSVIEIGDDISVEHKIDRGVITTLRGIVAKRMVSGDVRYYLTAEGATLFAFTPGKRTGIKITLYGRDTVPQTSLFEADFLAETRERIA